MFAGTPGGGRRRSLTTKQREALRLIERGAQHPDTWAGVVVGTRTYWDDEIKVAHINVHTARALLRKDLIRYGERDPEWGTEIALPVEGGDVTMERAGELWVVEVWNGKRWAKVRGPEGGPWLNESRAQRIADGRELSPRRTSSTEGMPHRARRIA